MKKLILLTCASAALTGCGLTPTTNENDCALNGPNVNKCHSMEGVHEAAVRANPQSHRTSPSVLSPGAQEQQSSNPYFNGQLNPMPAPSQNGMPVFQQPKVLRVWVAPYVDADGNLRSGEYAYVATPGQWNYGGLKKPGAAAGIFGPSRPDKLGFTPNLSGATPDKRGESGTKPASSTAPAQSSNTVPSAPPEVQQQARQAANPVTGITQPYQRLNSK